ncbi:hypothetical protein D3C78_1522920 [compost metagenome]
MCRLSTIGQIDRGPILIQDLHLYIGGRLRTGSDDQVARGRIYVAGDVKGCIDHITPSVITGQRDLKRRGPRDGPGGVQLTGVDRGQLHSSVFVCQRTRHGSASPTKVKISGGSGR